MNCKNVLETFNLDEDTFRELMEYTENKFDVNVNIPETIPDEDFISEWRCVLRAYEKIGIEKIEKVEFLLECSTNEDGRNRIHWQENVIIEK